MQFPQQMRKKATMSRQKFKSVIAHFVILFVFFAYIFLGACGLYFLIFPDANSISDDFDIESDQNYETSTQDYIEMTIDISCNEAKRRLEESGRRDFEQGQREERNRLRKFTFVRAALTCFNWITTIGNRRLDDWERVDHAFGAPKGGPMSKFYAIAYMLLGFPLTFIALLNCSAVFYDTVNSSCFAIRKKWRSKGALRRKRNIEESRFWNPLWFTALLITYLLTGALIFQRIELKMANRNVPYAESMWNCASLIFATGETTRDIFVLPQGALACFVQISYSFLGLILFGAFLRSFLPLAAKTYEPNDDEPTRRKFIQKHTEYKSVPPPIDGGHIRKVESMPPTPRIRKVESVPSTPQRMKRGSSTNVSTGGHTPRSILRQKNGAFPFDTKYSSSLDSLGTGDFTPSMVRFSMPKERSVTLAQIEPGRSATFERRLGSRLADHGLTKSTSREIFRDTPSPLLFSINPDSIPFVDERVQ